ncbi:MAG: hypothetical protein FWD98_05450 [Defluviitaleaceae bacterium]|nr:hypothetical protein [Defluviitaleaceae bacterium]
MLYKKMFTSIILIFIVSTALMIIFYQHNQLWSAFFSSIAAGCVTGVIFLLHQNSKEKDARRLKRQIKSHPQMCSRLLEIDRQFRINQRALLNAEGDNFHLHLAGIVKFANQYVREYSRLASAHPKYYRDFVYDSIGFKELFSEVMDKVDWLESKLDEPPPALASKDDNERTEYITIAHSVHCAFFEVYLKMENSAMDIAKKKHDIDESII